MGNKQLKNRVPIGSAVDKELYEKIKKYSIETGIPLSKILDKAILLFLESIKE